MVEILCFLQLFGKFIAHQGDPWEEIIATKSLVSLLDSLRGVKMEDFPMGLDDMPEPVIAPLDPLSAEWDVVAKISLLLQDVPQRTLKHVRDHQDASYCTLSKSQPLVTIECGRGSSGKSVSISVRP